MKAELGSDRLLGVPLETYIASEKLAIESGSADENIEIMKAYMSCWTGLNVFDYVRSYGNPFQQTDNHVKLYQKLSARVNSRFEIFRVKKLEFKNSLYDRDYVE